MGVLRLGRRDNVNIGSRPATTTPSGVMAPFAGSTAPGGWLLCDGTAVSRAQYSDLFATIGVAWGNGDGTTTFNLPDLRGRVPVGTNAGTFASLAATGGVESVTLSAAQSGLPSHSHGVSAGLGNGGSHSHSASTDSQGTHNHTVNQSYLQSLYTGTAGNGGGTSIVNGGASSSPTTNSNGAHTHNVSVGSGGDHTHGISVSISSAGGGGASSAHTNLQPYATVNYIIKT